MFCIKVADYKPPEGPNVVGVPGECACCGSKLTIYFDGEQYAGAYCPEHGMFLTIPDDVRAAALAKVREIKESTEGAR